MSPSRGPLIPPLMGPSTPPLLGPSGGEGAVEAAFGSFPLVRRSAGQGHGQKPPVTLPRYATLESARSIHRPSMGLLRRPTPGEIVEGGRFSRPYGRRAFARITENQFAASPPFRISTRDRLSPRISSKSPCQPTKGARPCDRAPCSPGATGTTGTT